MDRCPPRLAFEDVERWFIHVERAWAGWVAGLRSIERAAAVPHVLGAGIDPMPLGELARCVDLPEPTVHGIARTLCQLGFVDQEVDTGRYQLGPGRATVGATLDPRPSTRTCSARGR